MTGRDAPQPREKCWNCFDWGALVARNGKSEKPCPNPDCTAKTTSRRSHRTTRDQEVPK